MHPQVYAVYEEICSGASIQGPVLEVGTVQGPDSLLRMACFQGAPRRVGVSLEPAWHEEGCEIIQGNANEMPWLPSASFACVVCNATLEHDSRFWKTLSEIRRVTASGGLILIGVPGFAGMGLNTYGPRKSLLGRALRLCAGTGAGEALRAGTLTLGEHHFPGDYYRFTEQAVREILLEGLQVGGVRKVMNPPRFVGWGRKP